MKNIRHTYLFAVVYRCYASDGRLIYIGSTVNIKSRMYNHAGGSWFYDRIQTVRVEPDVTPNAARGREAAAIFREQPLLNQNGNPLYHGIGQQERTARVRLVADQLPLAVGRPQLVFDEDVAA